MESADRRYEVRALEVGEREAAALERVAAAAERIASALESRALAAGGSVSYSYQGGLRGLPGDGS